MYRATTPSNRADGVELGETKSDVELGETKSAVPTYRTLHEPEEHSNAEVLKLAASPHDEEARMKRRDMSRKNLEKVDSGRAITRHDNPDDWHGFQVGLHDLEPDHTPPTFLTSAPMPQISRYLSTAYVAAR